MDLIIPEVREDHRMKGPVGLAVEHWLLLALEGEQLAGVEGDEDHTVGEDR